MKAALYFHTLRHLQLGQIYHRVRAGLPRLEFKARPTPILRHKNGVWQPGVRHERTLIGPRRFRFLHQEAEVTPETWNDASRPKLWLYHLHYFHDLHADGAEDRREWHRELMRRWIFENPLGQGNGWEPYPISLRVVNWVRWHLEVEPLPQSALASFAAQARWLCQCLEFQHRGNHLWSNAKALIVAGTFFTGTEPDAWRAEGLRLLATELAEQLLSDGGHFERSPMYQCLILSDLLDVLNLARTFPSLSWPVDVWQASAERMSQWLAAMCHPDGRISFFNDAAFGMAPEPAELWRYGQRLGLAPPSAAGGVLPLPTSGYVRLEAGNAVLLFDGGDIGPDYQLAHAHADTLSFELSYDGQRLFVNSGVSTYAVGRERLRQRGTAAHNTVEVDGQDQSEVWASFRVARRARAYGLSWGNERGALYAEAAHDGYGRLRRPVRHHRRVELNVSGVRVVDRLHGGGTHSANLRFHLAPGLSVRQEAPNYFQIARAGAMVARIRFDQLCTATVSESLYHPEFGCSVPNLVLTGSWQGRCPARFTTQIDFAS